jgi:hypothetical protein
MNNETLLASFKVGDRVAYSNSLDRPLEILDTYIDEQNHARAKVKRLTDSAEFYAYLSLLVHLDSQLFQPANLEFPSQIGDKFVEILHPSGGHIELDIAWEVTSIDWEKRQFWGEAHCKNLYKFDETDWLVPYAPPTRRLLIVACSDRKAPGKDLTALARYDGPLYQMLRKLREQSYWVFRGLDVLILSAKYGLIEVFDHIEDYNQRMTASRTVELLPQVNEKLESIKQKAPFTICQTRYSPGNYEEILVSLGKDYRPAIADIDRHFPHTSITYTSGGIGQQISQVKRWIIEHPQAVEAQAYEAINLCHNGRRTSFDGLKSEHPTYKLSQYPETIQQAAGAFVDLRARLEYDRKKPPAIEKVNQPFAIGERLQIQWQLRVEHNSKYWQDKPANQPAIVCGYSPYESSDLIAVRAEGEQLVQYASPHALKRPYEPENTDINPYGLSEAEFPQWFYSVPLVEAKQLLEKFEWTFPKWCWELDRRRNPDYVHFADWYPPLKKLEVYKTPGTRQKWSTFQDWWQITQFHFEATSEGIHRCRPDEAGGKRHIEALLQTDLIEQCDDRTILEAAYEFFNVIQRNNIAFRKSSNPPELRTRIHNQINRLKSGKALKPTVKKSEIAAAKQRFTVGTRIQGPDNQGEWKHGSVLQTHKKNTTFVIRFDDGSFSQRSITKLLQDGFIKSNAPIQEPERYSFEVGDRVTAKRYVEPTPGTVVEVRFPQVKVRFDKGSIERTHDASELTFYFESNHPYPELYLLEIEAQLKFSLQKLEQVGEEYWSPSQKRGSAGKWIKPGEKQNEQERERLEREQETLMAKAQCFAKANDIQIDGSEAHWVFHPRTWLSLDADLLALASLEKAGINHPYPEFHLHKLFQRLYQAIEQTDQPTIETLLDHIEKLQDCQSIENIAQELDNYSFAPIPRCARRYCNLPLARNYCPLRSIQVGDRVTVQYVQEHRAGKTNTLIVDRMGLFGGTGSNPDSHIQHGFTLEQILQHQRIPVSLHEQIKTCHNGEMIRYFEVLCDRCSCQRPEFVTKPSAKADSVCPMGSPNFEEKRRFARWKAVDEAIDRGFVEQQEDGLVKLICPYCTTETHLPTLQPLTESKQMSQLNNQELNILETGTPAWVKAALETRSSDDLPQNSGSSCRSCEDLDQTLQPQKALFTNLTSAWVKINANLLRKLQQELIDHPERAVRQHDPDRWHLYWRGEYLALHNYGETVEIIAHYDCSVTSVGGTMTQSKVEQFIRDWLKVDPTAEPAHNLIGQYDMTTPIGEIAMQVVAERNEEGQPFLLFEFCGIPKPVNYPNPNTVFIHRMPDELEGMEPTCNSPSGYAEFSARQMLAEFMATLDQEVEETLPILHKTLKQSGKQKEQQIQVCQEILRQIEATTVGTWWEPFEALRQKPYSAEFMRLVVKAATLRKLEKLGVATAIDQLFNGQRAWYSEQKDTSALATNLELSNPRPAVINGAAGIAYEVAIVQPGHPQLRGRVIEAGEAESIVEVPEFDQPVKVFNQFLAPLLSEKRRKQIERLRKAAASKKLTDRCDHRSISAALVVIANALETNTCPELLQKVSALSHVKALLLGEPATAAANKPDHTAIQSMGLVDVNAFAAARNALVELMKQSETASQRTPTDRSTQIYTLDGDVLIGTVETANELRSLLVENQLTLDEVWGVPEEAYAVLEQAVGSIDFGKHQSSYVVNVKYTKDYDTYIGRGNPIYRLPQSKWHNPFQIGKHGNRVEVLQKYEAHLLGNAELMAALPELFGQTIACWCAQKGERLTADDPLKCHGQILLKALRGDYQQPTPPSIQYAEIKTLQPMHGLCFLAAGANQYCDRPAPGITLQVDDWVLVHDVAESARPGIVRGFIHDADYEGRDGSPNSILVQLEDGSHIIQPAAWIEPAEPGRAYLGIRSGDRVQITQRPSHIDLIEFEQWRERIVQRVNWFNGLFAVQVPGRPEHSVQDYSFNQVQLVSPITLEVRETDYSTEISPEAVVQVTESDEPSLAELPPPKKRGRPPSRRTTLLFNSLFSRRFSHASITP